MPRPRIRFSLRTFFALIALSTICCGGALAWSRRIDERVAVIERSGGTVSYEWESQIGLICNKEELEAARRWHPAFTRVRNFIDRPQRLWIDADLASSDFDRILLQMKQLGTFREVVISCDTFTSDHAHQLASIPSVTSIRIHGSGLTATGAQQLLASMHLRRLDLQGCTGIAEEPQLLREIAPQLESLDLSGAGVDPQRLAFLQAQYPHCIIRY